ncbi:MAG: prolyl oligopeptidase family serine peptidase [Bacteroidota bacterium]|nr:prolyl oligopeptidase family serine peptidase [Bacteroidota bacterium]
MKKHLFVFMVIKSLLINAQEKDDYLWLEEVDGKKAIEWVTQQNKQTIDKLSQEKIYQSIYDKSLEIYNSTERLAFPTIYGNYIYNFWQDKDHPRGIWRRTSNQNYLDGNPTWEIVLDIDALSKKDNIKWVFKGANGLYPNYDRFLVNLSNGGGDAVTVKEFDAVKKEFIENGFIMPEAKGGISYLDENTVIVSTDFGKGTMTTSGYARQVKLWKRGTTLKEAKLVFEGEEKDVAVSGYKMRDGEKSYLFFNRGISFYTSNTFVFINEKPLKLGIPEDHRISDLKNNQLIVELKSDWTINNSKYKQGSIISLNFTSLLNNKLEAELVYEPDEFSSVSAVASTKSKLLISILTNVKNELYIYSNENNKWNKTKVNAPDFGTIDLNATSELSDNYFFSFQNFLTPSSLFIGDAGANTIKSLKSLPAFFDASKFSVNQYKAKSNDGTMIPYFVISSKNMEHNSKNPTLLYAYGGFEVSMEPFYSGAMGKGWLENGGVYVLANIRGGGEFGPKWHQAGLKEKRQNVYNDFHAIAEDLINKKITSNKNLGIMGGSNGGLLMGVSFTQRPDLYNAVCCQVPLLDMKRFNKLLAGASWMGEYGDPDKPEEWEYIKKYSPYHNLKKDANYPEVFFTTSTRDDRVHPGHARKMVAKMQDMGYKVYYYENTEGGHAGSSTNEQRAKTTALQYAYLFMKLKNK